MQASFSEHLLPPFYRQRLVSISDLLFLASRVTRLLIQNPMHQSTARPHKSQIDRFLLIQEHGRDERKVVRIQQPCRLRVYGTCRLVSLSLDGRYMNNWKDGLRSSHWTIRPVDGASRGISPSSSLGSGWRISSSSVTCVRFQFRSSSRVLPIFISLPKHHIRVVAPS